MGLKNIKVIDAEGYSLTIFDDNIPTSYEVLEALSIDLFYDGMFVISIDFLSWELIDTTYYLYSGDILLREYDPKVNLRHMTCYFETSRDRFMFSQEAGILILYIEKCKGGL